MLDELRACEDVVDGAAVGLVQIGDAIVCRQVAVCVMQKSRLSQQVLDGFALGRVVEVTHDGDPVIGMGYAGLLHDLSCHGGFRQSPFAGLGVA